eukprot:gene1524-28593_t
MELKESLQTRLEGLRSQRRRLVDGARPRNTSRTTRASNASLMVSIKVTPLSGDADMAPTALARIPLPSRASLNELQDAVRNLLPKRSGEFYLEYDVGGGVPCVALVNPEGMRIFRESASKVTAATSDINVVIVKWRGQLVRSTPSPKEAPLSAPPSTVQRNFGMLHHFDMNHPPTKHKQHHRKHSQLDAATAVGGNEVEDNGSRVVHPNAVVSAIRERRRADKKIVKNFRELKGDLSLARHTTARILSRERDTARQVTAAHVNAKYQAHAAAMARREAAVAISAIAAASVKVSGGARATVRAVDSIVNTSSSSSVSVSSSSSSAASEFLATAQLHPRATAWGAPAACLISTAPPKESPPSSTKITTSSGGNSSRSSSRKRSSSSSSRKRSSNQKETTPYSTVSETSLSTFSEERHNVIHNAEIRKLLLDTPGLPAPFGPPKMSTSGLSVNQLPSKPAKLPVSFAAALSAAVANDTGSSACDGNAEALVEQFPSLSMGAADADVDVVAACSKASAMTKGIEATLDDESLARWAGAVFSEESSEIGGTAGSNNYSMANEGSATPSASMITRKAAAAVAAANQSSAIPPEWRPTPIKGSSGSGVSAGVSTGVAANSLSSTTSWQQPSASTPVDADSTEQDVGSRFFASASKAGVSLGSIKLSWGDSPGAALASTPPPPPPPQPSRPSRRRMLPPHPSSLNGASAMNSSARMMGTPLASKMKGAAGRGNLSSGVVFEAKPTAQCTNLGCNAKFDPFEPSGCKHHAAALDWRAANGYYWPCCQANSATYLSYTAASRIKGCMHGNHAESTSLLAKSITVLRAPPTGSKTGTLGARIKIRLSENVVTTLM